MITEMKRIFVILLIVFTLFGFRAYSQQESWFYVSKENIAMKIPRTWKVNTFAKPQGQVKIRAKSTTGEEFVEVIAVRVKINLSNRVTDIATERSQRETFQYMQIDQSIKTRFQGYDAQLLLYTNTFLNEVYKGGVYGFVNEGYTYTVEFYGKDEPQTKALLEQIIHTINVNATEDKVENIKSQEKNFDQKNWQTEEVDLDALRAEKERQKALQAAQEELLKAKKQAEKDSIEAQRQLEKQQKLEAKELEKQEKQRLKDLKKQQTLQAKQEKAKWKKTKQEKASLYKELGTEKLIKRKQAIDKQLNDISSQQLELNKQYGKAQKEENTKKIDKIKSQQSSLLQSIEDLSQEKNSIIKQLDDIERQINSL